MKDTGLLAYAKETLAIEIAEAQHLMQRLDDSVVHACQILLACRGKVVISGMGKSGHIGKKIAASLASTGTPAFFVHPAEALHGDLGMIDEKDVVILISYSGQVYELNTLLPLLVGNQIPVIALTGNRASPLARGATCILDVRVEREACPMGLAPTSSAVNTLIMGDALTIALMRHRGFGPAQFARFHPGGSLGAKLLNRVHHIMRRGEQMPTISMEGTVMDAMFELSRTGLGLTPICNEHRQVKGVFTDGDLRRWMVKGGSLSDPITKAMTEPGYQLLIDLWAIAALDVMHKQKISAAPVINEDGMLVGVINMHDLHQSGIE